MEKKKSKRMERRESLFTKVITDFLKVAEERFHIKSTGKRGECRWALFDNYVIQVDNTFRIDYSDSLFTAVDANDLNLIKGCKKIAWYNTTESRDLCYCESEKLSGSVTYVINEIYKDRNTFFEIWNRIIENEK